jgi:hypothetical protein
MYKFIRLAYSHPFLMAMGSGGNENRGACTFWVGMYKFNPNGAQGTFVTHLLPTSR